MAEVIRPYVDDAFYREDCRLRGITGEWVDCATHYLEIGWKSDADPSASFSTVGYLRDYPDIAASGLNPLYHFIAYGSGEGRRPRSAGSEAAEFVLGPAEIPDPPVRMSQTATGPDRAARRESRSAVRKDRFGRVAEVPLSEPGTPDEIGVRNHAADAAALVDDDFYRGYYPELRLDKGAAAQDFMTEGWVQGRDPNYWFDTRFYLSANPDVAASGVNPLVHYLAAGRFEGRIPRMPDLPEREALLAQRSIDAQAVDWRRAELPRFMSSEDSAVRLARELQSATRRGSRGRPSRGLVVQIVSDDANRTVGGVQLCVQAECAVLKAQDYDVMTVRPFQPLPILSPMESRELPLEVDVNGRSLTGAFRSTELAALVGKVADTAETSRMLLSIHGLLGHSPEILGRQLAQLNLELAIYWLHDYFLLCSSPQLTFDNLYACGAPQKESAQCSICIHGSQRRTQEERTLALLKSLGARIVSPSQAAADVFKQQSALAWSDIDVLPHGVLEAVGKRGASPRVGQKRVVRIGYLGNDVMHKGSLAFAKLRRAVAAHHDVELIQFGREPMGLPGVSFVKVSQSLNSLGTMTEALVNRGVDAVLVWPTWPETYSFVAHEALAAGCLVITHPDSGNVFPLAQGMDRCLAFDDVNSLLEAALIGQLSRSIRDHQSKEPALWQFKFTGLLPGLLARSQA